MTSNEESIVDGTRPLPLSANATGHTSQWDKQFVQRKDSIISSAVIHNSFDEAPPH
jgi:hypothetical protein